MYGGWLDWCGRNNLREQRRTEVLKQLDSLSESLLAPSEAGMLRKLCTKPVNAFQWHRFSNWSDESGQKKKLQADDDDDKVELGLAQEPRK